jgi:hypothetical protein
MSSIEINLTPDPRRSCGECQLCCKLLPIREGAIVGGSDRLGFNKPSNTKCQHQKFGTGCAIYATRPFACKTFSCRWLTNEDTADQSRPDRSRCVIDPMPDVVTVTEDGAESPLPVIQIWVDSKTPHAFREEPIRSFIERRGEDGYATIIRWSSSLGVVVFPASLAGRWFEKGGESVAPRPIGETLRAIAKARGD